MTKIPPLPTWQSIVARTWMNADGFLNGAAVHMRRADESRSDPAQALHAVAVAPADLLPVGNTGDGAGQLGFHRIQFAG